MARSKGIWPITGFTDFSQGESRLGAERSTVESIIRNGIDDKISNDKAKENAHDSGLAFLLSGQNKLVADAVATIGGGIDLEMAAKILAEARRLTTTGTTYVYGAPSDPTDDNPKALDCSGMTKYVFKRVANIDLPRVSIDQGKLGTLIKDGTITAEELKVLPKPADLIFFKGTNKNRAAHLISHVAICVGDGTGKMIHASSSRDCIIEVNTTSWTDEFHSIRRILPESSGLIAEGSSDPLDGYTLPTTSGYGGFEEAIDATGAVGSTGGKVSFHQFASMGQEYRDYYITMRWNFVAWYWNGTYTDSDKTQSSWMRAKPRIVLVTNTRTGKKIYAAALESGPAPWTGTPNGKTDAQQKALWGDAARRGNPQGYTGRSAGFPPAAVAALGGMKQQVHGTGGDLLTFEWAKDQNVKPGPVN